MKSDKGIRNDRLKRAAGIVKTSPFDAYLLSSGEDICYLTGFFVENALVVVFPKGGAIYLVDSMNDTLAAKTLKGVEIEMKSGRTMQNLAEVLKKKRIGKLGVDGDSLSAFLYKSLLSSGRRPGVKMAESPARRMRQIKGRGEIEVMRRIAGKTSRIWERVKEEICEGMTEKELALFVDVNVRKEGYTNSFPTIAAFGENTSYPHAVPTERKLGKREHALLDFGVRSDDGYCSDLTRMWVKGRISRKISDCIKAVSILQNNIIKELRPGVPIGNIVRKANKFFRDGGLEKYARHGLGHGVGLNIHEMPFLRETADERLKKGMVFTIEPGLYVPGEGGSRIEDMVLITEKGCEVLTR